MLNRGVGTNTIWVTNGSSSPVDPAAEGDNCIPVYAGQAVRVALGTQSGYVVKVIGSADPYSVYGAPR